MPQRICPDCHHLHGGPNQRCADCQATAEHRRGQRRGNSAARGYDGTYQRNKPTVIAQAKAGRPCFICGEPLLPGQDITVEHIRPLRDGGTSELGNLAPAHAGCNSAWNKRR